MSIWSGERNRKAALNATGTQLRLEQRWKRDSSIKTSEKHGSR